MKNYKRMLINQPFSVCLVCAMLAGAALAQQAAITPSTSNSASATAPKPANAPIKIGGLTVFGSLRLRAESWDWFDPDPAYDDSYTFGAAVLRVGLGQQKEKYEWQVEGEFPALMGTPESAIAPAPQGQLGLGASYFAANRRQDATAIIKQGFIRLKGAFGDKAASLKLGRFEFNEGLEVIPSDPALAVVKRDHISQRLIGAFGFTHIGRSFDGLQYSRNSKAGNFTLFGARPTEGVFQLNGNHELDVDVWYAAFTRPGKHKTGESEWRAFATYYHDGRRTLKTDNRPAGPRGADTENIRITTVGGHFIGAYKAGRGATDVLLWGAGQFGRWGRLDQRSGAIAAEAGWRPGGRVAEKIKPWFRGGYFRSTGDGDPSDGRHGAFFQMLPTPRIYARTPFYNLMNNEDAFGQLRLSPHAKVNLRFDAHHLRLSDSKDLWYAGGGAFQKRAFGFLGRPSNGKKDLGWLFDFSADVIFSARTAMTVYLGGVRGGAVQSAIYPQGLGGGANPRARFFYVELTQKF
ncbi:MAG TPA: alginate export family protein [Blastocatellia bacterium]|nr:alginate export family protein [Blastocatellia bacterium]